EYQGQKCSAASRVYVPDSLWPRLRERLVDEVPTIAVGDVTDPDTYIGAVIDGPAFGRHREAIERARQDPSCEVIVGGETDDESGWFVKPTVIHTDDPNSRFLQEEIFGPIVTVF